MFNLIFWPIKLIFKILFWFVMLPINIFLAPVRMAWRLVQVVIYLGIIAVVVFIVFQLT